MALVQRYVGTYATAKSATDKIDYNGIAKYCDAIASDSEGFFDLSNSIGNAGSDLTSETFNYNGNTMDAHIEEIRNGIIDGYDSIVSATENIKAEAEAKYNEIQIEYNDQAKKENDRIASEERLKNDLN